MEVGWWGSYRVVGWWSADVRFAGLLMSYRTEVWSLGKITGRQVG